MAPRGCTKGHRVTPQDIIDGHVQVRIPPAARVKLCELAGAPWSYKDPTAKLSELQREVLARPERTKVVHGGSGLGKSVLGGCELLIESMIPNSKFAAVAASYDHVANEWEYLDRALKRLFRTTPQVFERIVFRNSQSYQAYEVKTIWNAQGLGITTHTDEGAQLLGKEFTRIVLGEGSHIGMQIYERRIARALDRSMMRRPDGTHPMSGYLSIYTTPKEYSGCSAALHEVATKRTRGKLELLHYPATQFADSFWFREASVMENPAYSREVFESRRESLDKDAFAEQYLGKMTYRTGRVYRSYDTDRHRALFPKPEVLQSMRFGIGIDTGAYTGCLLAGVARDGTIWSLVDCYTEQRTINETLDEFGERIMEAVGPAFPGLSLTDFLVGRVDVCVVDPASQHKLEITAHWPEVVLTVPATTLGGKMQLLPSVEAVEELFKQGRLRVTESWCDALDEQLRKYLWKTKKVSGSRGDTFVVEPKKEFDHMCDAHRMVTLVLADLGPTIERPRPLTLREAQAAQRQQKTWGELRAMMAAGERGGKPRIGGY